MFELQITQTRHPKSVADRGTDEQTNGRSGPTTRPAFAKATQVKTICLPTLPGGRHNNMRCSWHNYYKNQGRGQGHSDLKMVCNTRPSQDAYTHQILDSYLK